jgi:hypothetical protein
MIRRLIILLLIVGCEEPLEPEDCAGVAGGNSYLDECGGCDANVNNDCIQDCADVWGGTAVEDDCGVCGGDNSSCICDGLTEVELWGETYDIGTTASLDPHNSQEFTGSIPPEIGCLTNLTSLFLGGNQLTGEIPSEIWELTNLTLLNLGHNQLTGEIPVEIGNLTNLTGLALYSNQLTGEIPSEIGNLTNLEWLKLYNNQLSGEIPSEVCDLIESNNLNMDLILDGNNLINTCD